MIEMICRVFTANRASVGLSVLALVIAVTAVTTLGQNPRRMNQPRFDPQFGRRNRLPGRRGLDTVRPKLNPAQRQELQRRLIQALGLSPDQHQRMQQIRREHEEERIVAGRRLRQARQALDRAIMSENYDEAAVRRATDELTAAQADRIRLESRIRSQIRGVMTPEQVNRFHQLERELRREMRQEQQQQQNKDGDELELLELTQPR